MTREEQKDELVAAALKQENDGHILGALSVWRNLAEIVTKPALSHQLARRCDALAKMHQEGFTL